MGGQRFIAVVSSQHYFGVGILRPGQQVRLIKEPENTHDGEAIKVELEPAGKVGYVANSVHTVPKGCQSAGRIYEAFEAEALGTVRFVTKETAIVEVSEE